MCLYVLFSNRQCVVKFNKFHYAKSFLYFLIPFNVFNFSVVICLLDDKNCTDVKENEVISFQILYKT